MTFETGTATNLEDLLAKLDTFAQVTHGGWSSAYASNPDVTNRWFELNKGSLSMSIRYPASIGAGDSVSVHHATGSAGSGVAPGAHTADSGSGYNVGTAGTSGNFEAERCLRAIGNGPFPSYHFFADDTDNDYIYAVIEIESGHFRHLNFGTLDKFGDNWTGGEFVCGHYQESNANAAITDVNTQVLMDGLGTTSERTRAATLRINAGLPDLSPAVWGVSASVVSSGLLTDTAGNVRRQIHGGHRAGVEANGWGVPFGNSSGGFIGGYQISAYYRNPTLARVHLLGFMPDVRAVNCRNFEPAQTVTQGGETWYIFPVSIRTEAAVPYRSRYGGIAYRLVP